MNIYPIILIHNIKLGSSTYVKKCSYSVNLVQDPFFKALITIVSWPICSEVGKGRLSGIEKKSFGRQRIQRAQKNG